MRPEYSPGIRVVLYARSYWAEHSGTLLFIIILWNKNNVKKAGRNLNHDSIALISQVIL